MSTKTSTTSQNTLNYDPGSKGIYSGLQSSIGSTLSDFMTNPLQASYFNQAVGMGQKQISQQQSSLMGNVLNNFRTQGYTGAAPTAFAQSQMANIGRQTSGLQANNFLQNLMQARGMQLQATGMAQSYQPLLTGTSGQSTQTTGGLGTWLPQLAGAAIGGLTGGLTGGLGSLTNLTSSAGEQNLGSLSSF